MEIKITYTIDEHDYMYFQRYALYRSKAYRKQRTIIKYLLPCICILALIFILLTKEFKLPPFIFLLVAFSAVSIYWVKRMPKLSEKKILDSIHKKNLSTDAKTSVMGERTLTFTDDKIYILTKEIESKMNWSALIGFEEDDKFLFLFVSSTSAHAIPKQKVPQWEAIKQMIETKLGESSKVK